MSDFAVVDECRDKTKWEYKSASSGPEIPRHLSNGCIFCKYEDIKNKLEIAKKALYEIGGIDSDEGHIADKIARRKLKEIRNV